MALAASSRGQAASAANADGDEMLSGDTSHHYAILTSVSLTRARELEKRCP